MFEVTEYTLADRSGLRKDAGSLLTTIGLSVFFLGCSIYAFILFLNAPGLDLRESYFALMTAGVYFSASILLANARHHVYLLEPYVMVTAVYSLVYFFAPLFMFSIGETARYGVDVAKYGMAGTLLVVLGHIAFSFGYFVRGNGRADRAKTPLYQVPVHHDLLAKVAYVIWLVSAFLVIFYHIGRGFSLGYILSGGLAGSSDAGISEGKLQFLSYFSYSMISAWLAAACFGRNGFLKLASYIVTIALVFFGGTRAAILIPLLSPFVLSYLKRRRAPSMLAIGLAVSCLIVLFAVMQVARVGIRMGSGFSIVGETFASLFEPFRAEIDDFKAFYAVLGVVPAKHDYLLGSTMIGYSLVILIPRALWPGKPYPETYEIVRLAFGDYAVKAGVAYPALAEYYVEFGVVGVAVCMLICGILCRRMKRLYLHADGVSVSLIMYSVLLPALFQFVIRGYMPQNFTMVLFLIAPLFILKVIDSKLHGSD